MSFVKYRRRVIGLAGQIDVGLQTEVKDLLVLQKVIITNHGAHLHQGVIAGKHQGAFQGNDTVAGLLRAFNLGLALYDNLSAVAEEGGGIIDQAQLQSRCHRHGFYG